MERFFNTDVVPVLNQYEDRRERLAKRFKIVAWLILGISIILLAAPFVLTEDVGADLKWVLFIVFMGVFCAAVAYTYMTDSFKADVKNVSVGMLCDYLKWDYQHKDFASLPLEEFSRLGLLPDFGEGDSKQIEDKISGKEGPSSFSLHELHLVSGGRSKATKFQGQILSVDCSRECKGETVVLRNSFISPSHIDETLKKVGLIDSKFNSIFNVYSTDQVEARYLLPPDFMQLLIDLETSVDGRKLRFGFSRSKLLIAIETEDRYEMGSIFSPLSAPERNRKVIRELGAITKIINSLDRR